MNAYTPDKWVIVELVHGTETIRKIFGGWYGGYTSGDSWKLSSEITSETDMGEYIAFGMYSGSVYNCYKGSRGMSAYMSSVYAEWQRQQTADMQITVMHDLSTWLTRQPFSLTSQL